MDPSLIVFQFFQNEIGRFRDTFEDFEMTNARPSEIRSLRAILFDLTV
jgi:hypothetical protein